MSKPKKKTARTPTPADVAAKLVTKHLSDDSLYGQVLDQISPDEFRALENAVLATMDTLDPSVAEDRVEATQEVCFRLGLEMGRRLGGAR